MRIQVNNCGGFQRNAYFANSQITHIQTQTITVGAVCLTSSIFKRMKLVLFKLGAINAEKLQKEVMVTSRLSLFKRVYRGGRRE